MGLFDDIMGIVNEGNALRNEISQLGSDVVKELNSDVEAVTQTVSDTGGAAQSLVQDLGLQTPGGTDSPSDQQQNS